MLNLINTISKNEEGATAIEYGLITALIATALILSIQAVTGSILGAFETAETSIEEANNSVAAPE
jgi:pilus assembly protein Flp/PilA